MWDAVCQMHQSCMDRAWLLTSTIMCRPYRAYVVNNVRVCAICFPNCEKETYL